MVNLKSLYLKNEKKIWHDVWKKKCLFGPNLPTCKIWAKSARFLTRPDPARPSRFWGAYYSETMCFRENIYKTKNDHLLHKFNVLKFGVDSFIGIKGRPLFVRVTLFWFFYYIFWSIENFEDPKIGFERSLQYLSDGIHLNF